MSNPSGSSFVLHTPDSVASKQLKNTSHVPEKSFITQSTSISAYTPSAGPSSLRSASNGPHLAGGGIRPAATAKKRTDEELSIMQNTKERFASRIQADQEAVLHPDVDSPFADVKDAVNRLLPYHIYQQPTDDLEWLRRSKGKQKASPEEEELSETKLALECHKRYRALNRRFKKIRIKEGKRTAPGDQAYALAQAVLDSERTETAWLNTELRNARAELDKFEREKRAAAPPPTTARTSYYNSTPVASSTLQAQWYRPYPYTYNQPYPGVTAPMNITYTTPVTSATFSTVPTIPTTTTTTTTTAPSATTPAPTQAAGNSIPVQLPVSSLPALHALGITPVPAGSITTGQAPPPAVLRGSSANGTMLSLEINVSLLKSAQMSGLAIILNSLMSRGTASSSTAATPTTAPSSPLVKSSVNGSSTQ